MRQVKGFRIEIDLMCDKHNSDLAGTHTIKIKDKNEEKKEEKRKERKKEKNKEYSIARHRNVRLRQICKK